MDLRSPLGLLDSQPTPDLAEPQFLLELEPRTPAFFRNLFDALLFRTAPRLDEFPQAPFWDDVFVRSRTPWAGLSTSGFGHIATVAAIYVVVQLPMFQTRPQTLADPFENRTITYYEVSEYLPPINLNSSPAKHELKGDPAPAKQEILSVPPEPDNSRQTIVTAPQVKLRDELKMPNLVVWEDAPVAQPTAASQRSVSQLSVPQLKVDVVAPTADVNSTQAKMTLPWLRPQLVEPQADVANLRTSGARSLEVAVVAPTAQVDDVRRIGQMNMAPALDVAAPKLSVTAQRAAPADSAAGTQRVADAVPPAPSMQGLQNSTGSGRVIALNLHPADITGPVQMPGGNRSGVFASSPTGKEGAPGTPTLKAGGTGTGGVGAEDSKKGPAGISVGEAPAATAPTNAKPALPLNEAQKQVLFASLRRPSLPPPKPAQPVTDAPATGVEGEVFGGKKFYSMVMNMPNLTSKSGSWVIKFAELKEGDLPGDLLAPVATLKVDPAYPPELMRDHVEGTVVLYAVIHSDGHVDDVRVLTSVDARLDHNAVRALSGWHFRPATKNGKAVALEAVVQIPFRVSSPL